MKSNQSNPPAKITRNVLALGLVSLFTDTASEMIYPLVPIFVALLGSGAVILGVIEGIAETTAALLKLMSGIISDRIGKRKLLVVLGYGISTIIRPFTGIVTAAWQIVLVRLGDRVGKGIRTAPRDALIAASIDSRIRGKAYGFHRAMDHAGAVLGPVLAVATLILFVLVFKMTDTVQILRWTFIFAIIPGLCAIFALIFLVQEKKDPVASTRKFSFSLKPFDKNFLTYLGIVTLFSLGNSSDAFLLFRVQEALHHSQVLSSVVYALPVIGKTVRGFGTPDAQQKLIEILFLPLVWAFFHVIKVLFSTPLGALSDRIGRKIVINLGWGIYAAVYLAFAFLDRLPEVWQITATFILFGIYALYYAFSEGAEKAFVADLVKPELRGSAFGLFSFATGLAALPASILFGLLYNVFGAAVAFGTGAVLAGAAMGLFILLIVEPGK